MEATTSIGNPNGLISPTIILTDNLSNKTMDPFPEDKHLTSEHIIILTWFFFTGFLSTAGNAIVLVSSIKYNAIHLDRVSIILIRNLAIADLGFGLSLFSSAMNEAMRWNVFGHRICGIIRIVTLFFLYASSCFLASLNLNMNWMFCCFRYDRTYEDSKEATSFHLLCGLHRPQVLLLSSCICCFSWWFIHWIHSCLWIQWGNFSVLFLFCT